MIYTTYYKSPIGTIKITGDAEKILSLDFIEDDYVEVKNKITEPLEKCAKEIDEYFNGKRKDFTVRIHMEGTDFQVKVWNELLKIPYGKTLCYEDIAEAIQNKKAVRAVGGANNKNKISIIIPCHRVIGKNGSLTGYGGGLWRKEWLLSHERKFS